MPPIIEAEQGDSISGKVSRAEVAQVISQALEMPAAAGKDCLVYAPCRNVHQCSPRHPPKTVQHFPKDTSAITCSRAIKNVHSLPFAQSQCLAELPLLD